MSLSVFGPRVTWAAAILAGLVWAGPFAEASELGDGEGDGDVDLVDYALFQVCYPAPSDDAGPSATCLAAFDFDVNAKLDEIDAAGFLQAMTDSASLAWMALRIGPVTGLTSAWHPAPLASAIPRGGNVELMVIGLPLNAVVTWTNAVEAERAGGISRAVCALENAGPLTVSASASVPGIQAVRSIALTIMDVPPEDIQCSAIQVTVAPFNVTEDSPNGVTMQYWFAEDSIASLTQSSPGLYRTSVGRAVTFRAELSPSAFAPLLEWRIVGQPPRLATEVTQSFGAPNLYAVSAGAVGAPQVLSLQTYRVTITDPSEGAVVPEGQPVVFTAVTEPPGLEDEIAWLSSTKYGSAEPTLGVGQTFTVQFDDTVGQQPDGRPFQWFGVRADNALFSQGKIMGACCVPPYVGLAGCVQNTESGCLAVNGQYQGDGTMCTMPQACCFSSGVCSMIDPLCCDEAGGTLAPGACGEYTVGCCLPDGSCVDMDPTCCEARGGIPKPDGDLCNPQACCLPNGTCTETDPYCCTFIPGAVSAPGHCQNVTVGCCMPDGSCADMDPTCCEALGGIPKPDGDLCTPRACCLPDGTCRETDPYCCTFVPGAVSHDGQCSAPQACCLPDLTCRDLDPLCCVDLGGIPQGPGSMCTAPEACCLPDGSCSNLDPLCCLASGGIPQGPGTICTAPEACCLANGDCIMIDPQCCDEAGGIPQGAGSMCTQVEACCLPDGSCSNLDPLCCLALGGIPQGLGTVCTLPEACCLLDGSCIMIDPLCCDDFNGNPQGAGSACTAPEACCFADGSCSDLDPLCCVDLGGIPDGPGACLPPEACCLPDGSCVDVDPGCCVVSLGGVPSGPGLCALEACCLPGGSCIDTDPACCVQVGGEPAGPGPCGPLEACCLPSGECLETDPECCELVSGLSQGPLSDCDPAGACCFGDESCQETSAECCLAMNGDFLGGGSSCDSEPCALGACCDQVLLTCTQTRSFDCNGFWDEGVPCEPDPCETCELCCVR